jgi:myo-inositol-1(or 4)-monophosphatase
VRIHRRDAGRISLEGATEKGRADYVSQTDLDAQEAALEVIAERHPDHAILAEEGPGSVEEQLASWDGRPLWIVDPLDGTANFLHDHPLYCASVAVAIEGRPVAGAVVSGSSDERWWAAEGEGAFKNGDSIRVSERSRLRDALVGTGFPFKNVELLPEYLAQLDRVLRAASGLVEADPPLSTCATSRRGHSTPSGRKSSCHGISRRASCWCGKRAGSWSASTGAS